MSAELFAALSDAGHGDKIVLASSNFPSAALAKLSKAALIRIDALTADIVLEEIMKFIKVRYFSLFHMLHDCSCNKRTLKRTRKT